ncbi:MAG: IS6 family transposase, partial [Cyanobacteria bacterium J06626_14]
LNQCAQRYIKRRIKPGLGFSSFNTAWHTLQGYEVMNMIRQGQINGVAKGNVIGQISFINEIFGMTV